MRHYPRKKKRSHMIGCALGMLLVAGGAWLVVQHSATSASYAALAEQVVTDRASVEVAPIEGAIDIKDAKAGMIGDREISTSSTVIDWDALKQENAEIVAWVSVEGTDISLPVLEPADGDMNFYLTHDLWRRYSVEGVPFLDHRCTADGIHRMVYGHHHSMGGQFSSLQRAYRQEVFNTLGSCHWTTPDKGASILMPFCSMSVDMWYEAIQEFEFDDWDDLGAWLRGLAAASSARNESWQEVSNTARSVVTLVTCSSNFAGKQWRTLVLFVEVPDL